MNDKIVFRCMQKALFGHEALEKAIDSLISIPSFSTYQIRDDLITKLHRLKLAELHDFPGDSFPCYADDKTEDKKDDEIKCICWLESRERPD